MLLSCIQHKDTAENSKVPSWVPIWHLSSATTLTRFDAVSRTRRPNTRYNKLHIDKDMSLHCDGVQLDTVLLAMPAATEDSERDAVYSLVLSLVDMVNRATEMINSEPVQHAPDGVITVDAPLDRDVIAGPIFWALLGGSVHEQHEIAAAKLEVDRFRAWLTDSVEIERRFVAWHLLEVPQLKRSLATRCKQHALYVTRKGYIGLGPWHTSPGDVVCALASAGLPMMLRSNADAWVLIGETYMHPVSPIETANNRRRRAEMESKINNVSADLVQHRQDSPIVQGCKALPATSNEASTGRADLGPVQNIIPSIAVAPQPQLCPTDYQQPQSLWSRNERE